MTTRSKSGKSKSSKDLGRASPPAKPVKGSAKRKTSGASPRSAPAPFTVEIKGVEGTLEQLAALGLDLGLAIDTDALAADPDKLAALVELLNLLNGSGSLIAISRQW